MGDNDRLFGWTFQQYLVAATWLHSKGHSIDWGPETTIQYVQLIWGRNFNDAPLTGAMQVYQPEINEDVRMHIVVAWVHITSREMSFTSREMSFRHTTNGPNPIWRSPV